MIVGVNIVTLAFIGFDKYSLFYVRAKLAGQFWAKLVGGIGNQPMMYAAPALFQIRIHSGKGLFMGELPLLQRTEMHTTIIP